MIGERLVTPSTALAVPFDEAVEHLMLDPSEAAEIALDLEAMIREATEYVEGQTRRALLTQTWVDSYECFPAHEIAFRRWPVQSLTSIEYVDQDGDSQTIDSAEYQVSLYSMPAMVKPAPSASWPTPREQFEAVKITYVAGHGDAPEDLPASARAYVKAKIEDLWRVRGTLEIGRRAQLVPKVEARLRAALEVPYL